MAVKKVGVVGSGVVSQVLADGLLKHGYEVMRGTREAAKLADWKKSAGPKASVGGFSDTAKFGELVLIAVKGSAAESAVKLCGPDLLAGKTVIDATNPIAEAPPTNGVLKFFTTLDESLMERLQKLAPKARFVKAFSCVGNGHMVNPDFGGTKPTMFICGNEASAKGQVKDILTQFGWETEDMGGAEAARAIEPLCMLWCIPGLLRNQWSHAFKLLKK
ncbi:MAG TPA: NAD(P)-binding domain-containing protein [Planctomycetota bacterium]|nr:NAD(P)-binding domain-containing protein [Planctomycetota bacterium]